MIVYALENSDYQIIALYATRELAEEANKDGDYWVVEITVYGY